MNHHDVLSDFSFALKPEAPALAAASDLTESSDPSPTNSMVPLEVDDAAKSQTKPQKKRGHQIKAFGKKLGGAIQKINVVKWIDDLEQDQELADHLDRINADRAEEQERQLIRQQALEACLNTMREHLLEFLTKYPQATYEQWICNLHPDNINTQMEGLTQTPMIDHRFYVADSDHRILWNEHLNDLDDKTNMAPVRHFVTARTFVKKPSGIMDDAPSNVENNNLIGLEDDNQQQLGNHSQNGPVDLLSM